MRMDSAIENILDKALNGGEVNREDALALMDVTENAPEMYALASFANTLTQRQFGGKGGGLCPDRH